jgi:cysteinyl-tRNA synthetase
MRAAPDDAADAGVLAWLEQQRAGFVNALDDDFNTPAAVAVLFDLTAEVNKLLNSNARPSRGTWQAIDDAYRAWGGQVLGLVPDQLRRGADDELLDGLVKLLIEMRAEARVARDYGRADAIRERLTGLGVTLEDRPEGTVWRLGR